MLEHVDVDTYVDACELFLPIRRTCRAGRTWKAEMMSSFSSLLGRQPARIVPPYTITDGRLTRAIAITHPGMFLSQPGMDRFAS